MAALDLKWLSSKYLTKSIGFKLWKYIEFCSSSHTFMEIDILESSRFYKFLLNRNVGQFIFFFFSRMLFIPLCYLKRALFRLEIYLEFSRFFLYGQCYRPKEAKRNSWICAVVKASLVAISIIVVKNFIFTFQKQSSEGFAKYISLEKCKTINRR